MTDITCDKARIKDVILDNGASGCSNKPSVWEPKYSESSVKTDCDKRYHDYEPHGSSWTMLLKTGEEYIYEIARVYDNVKIRHVGGCNFRRHWLEKKTMCLILRK
jgi:hypothetical protein